MNRTGLYRGEIKMPEIRLPFHLLANGTRKRDCWLDLCGYTILHCLNVAGFWLLWNYCLPWLGLPVPIFSFPQAAVVFFILRWFGLNMDFNKMSDGEVWWK